MWALDFLRLSRQFWWCFANAGTEQWSLKWGPETSLAAADALIAYGRRDSLTFFHDYLECLARVLVVSLSLNEICGGCEHRRGSGTTDQMAHWWTESWLRVRERKTFRSRDGPEWLAGWSWCPQSHSPAPLKPKLSGTLLLSVLGGSPC